MRGFNVRKLFLAFMDALFIFVGTFATNWIFSMVAPAYTQGSRGLLYICVTEIILCFLVQFVVGSYSKTWHYYGLKDYIICAAGMFGGQFLSYLIFFALQKWPSKLFFLVNFVVITAMAILFRMVFRKTFIILTRAGRDDNTERTLIIGAGRAEIMYQAYRKKI